MSEFEPLPPPRQVSLAYSAVQGLNRLIQEKAITIEDFRIESIRISNLPEVETPEGEEPKVVEPDTSEPSPDKRKALFTPLDGCHISVLSAIGIVLDPSLTGSVTTTTEVKSVERVVPELLRPERFADYLGEATHKRTLRSPIQRQLASDVIERIYDKLAENGRIVSKALLAEPRDEDIVFRLFARRYTYIEQFRTIEPIYERAKLHRFTPYYGQVKEWADPAA